MQSLSMIVMMAPATEAMLRCPTLIPSYGAMSKSPFPTRVANGAGTIVPTSDAVKESSFNTVNTLFKKDAKRNNFFLRNARPSPVMKEALKKSTESLRDHPVEKRKYEPPTEFTDTNSKNAWMKGEIANLSPLAREVLQAPLAREVLQAEAKQQQGNPDLQPMMDLINGDLKIMTNDNIDFEEVDDEDEQPRKSNVEQVSGFNPIKPPFGRFGLPLAKHPFVAGFNSVVAKQMQPGDKSKPENDQHPEPNAENDKHSKNAIVIMRRFSSPGF